MKLLEHKQEFVVVNINTGVVKTKIASSVSKSFNDMKKLKSQRNLDIRCVFRNDKNETFVFVNGVNKKFKAVG